MANNDNPNQPPSTRQSRREERFARQEQEQLRTFRIIGMAIGGVLLLIILIGLIIEFLFVPSQAVATVNGTDISMREWRDQVRFQRAQLVGTINENYDLFHDAEAEDQEDARQNTLRTMQQFFGQQINVLAYGDEQLGNGVLESMISTELVKQEAARRGLEISDTEIDEEIGRRYSYYGGGLPTPQPTAEPTVEPTPSITPLPDPNAEPVEEEPTPEPIAEEEAAEELPTATPFPTNTPVSEESFNEQLDEDLAELDGFGVDPGLNRVQAEESILFRRLGEAIYEDNGGDGTAPHVTSFLIVYGTQEEAEAGLAKINSDGFLQVWNEIRSFPAPADSTRPAQAIERIAWTAEEYDRAYESLSSTLFELAPGTVSDIIEDGDVQTSFPIYVIAQVTANETLELPSFRVQQLQSEALQDWLEDARTSEGIQVFENWRNRIPRQPALNSDFSLPVPTITPPAEIDTGS